MTPYIYITYSIVECEKHEAQTMLQQCIMHVKRTGRFIFLRSPIVALFSTLHVTSRLGSSHETTVRTRDPSATRICCPGLTEVANFS